MDDYLSQCERFGGGAGNLAVWEDLRRLLGHGRDGWTFEVLNPEIDPVAAWRFGLAGAGRLVVTVDGERVNLYESERDTDHTFESINELARWLEENEERYEGFTPQQEELIDYLLPIHVEKWAAEQDE